MTYRGIATLLLSASLALSACAKKEERVFFDGVYFPVKDKAIKDDRQSFVVTVRRAERSIKGAREAGRHGGTDYCLKNFGTSDIEWTLGPDVPDHLLERSGGNLVFRGRCVLW